MAITFNPETLDIAVDQETVNRLTTGTPFQRGLNALTLLDGLMAEIDADLLKGLNLPKEQQQNISAEMAETRLKMLKEFAPPNIDADALTVFCEIATENTVKN